MPNLIKSELSRLCEVGHQMDNVSNLVPNLLDEVGRSSKGKRP